MIVGSVATLAGCALLANAERMARDAERQFYGPVTPTGNDRKRDHLMLQQLGANPVRNRIGAVAFVAWGVIALIFSFAH